MTSNGQSNHITDPNDDEMFPEGVDPELIPYLIAAQSGEDDDLDGDEDRDGDGDDGLDRDGILGGESRQFEGFVGRDSGISGGKAEDGGADEGLVWDTRIPEVALPEAQQSIIGETPVAGPSVTGPAAYVPVTTGATTELPGSLDLPAQLDTGEEEMDEDDVETLRALILETLLNGADPSLIADLFGEDSELDLDEDGDSDMGDLDGFTGSTAAHGSYAFDEHGKLLDEAEIDAAAQAASAAIYRHLLSRTPEHDIDPTKKRVRQVLDVLGDPQDAYPSIHIAGTNGKTSTTKIAAALLSAFGLRTGSFTSPHLQDVRERIAINTKPLTPAQFVAAWEDVAPYIELIDQKNAEVGQPQISYFEALTIMAMAAFQDAPVDVAVFETGMGGRWDATNVLDSGVAVLTPIALDHEKWLGSTIEQIASEKAQIIKDKSIVVVMRQEDVVLEIIKARAKETDSIIWLEGRDFEVLERTPGVGGQLIDVRTPTGVYEDIFLPLHGKHQARNAAAALVAVESMMGGKSLLPEVLERGFISARSPGRLEVVRTSPTVVVDAAHNPAGVAALRDGLEEAFHFGYTVGVFSAMEDKNIEAMLVEIEADINQLVITEMPGERAVDLEVLKAIAIDVFGEDRVHVEKSLVDVIEKAATLSDAPTDQTITRGIVVFGSIALAGEVTALMQG